MKIYIYSSPFRTMPLGREAVKIYVKELAKHPWAYAI